MLALWGVAFAAGPAKVEDQAALISGSFEDLWGYDTSSRFRRLGQSVGLVRVVQKKGGISTPSTCTATVIAPDKVLTNYHCVPGRKENVAKYGPVMEASLVLGFLALPDAPGRRYTLSLTPVEGNEALDYAILNVNETLGSDYPPVPFTPYAAALSRNRPLFVLHHPLDSPLVVTKYDCKAGSDALPSGTVDTYGNLHHTCATQKGSSGALVFDEETMQVVALHKGAVTEAEEPYGIATPIQKILDVSPELKKAVVRPTGPTTGPTQAGLPYQGLQVDPTGQAKREECERGARAAGEARMQTQLDAQLAEKRGVVQRQWETDGPKFEACVSVTSADMRAQCKASLESFVKAARGLTASVDAVVNP